MTTRKMDTQKETRTQKVCHVLRKRLLVLLTILGIILGFAIGIGLRFVHVSADAIMWLGLPGEVFISLLKMPILPLIISSVISAVGRMDPAKNGKVGLIFLALHMSCNIVCAGLGIVLGITVKPGRILSNDTYTEDQQHTGSMETQDIAADMIRNLFPDNLVRATIQTLVTKYDVTDKVVDTDNGTMIVAETTKHLAFDDSMNILGLIFGCTVFGLAAGRAGEQGKAMLSFFESVTAVMLIVLQWFLWFAPVGICSLIVAAIVSITNLSRMFIKLGLFVGTVSIGLFVIQLIILPGLYFLVTRNNPFKALVAIFKPWCVTFASTSSPAAMPYMYIACKRMKIDERVTSFGVPIAVTINAAGSAMFVCVAVVFIAQLSEIWLSSSQLITIFLLTATSSMALPAAPSASILLIVILCTTFSIPVESIGLLFAIEWLMDRLRSASNVTAEVFMLLLAWQFVKKDFQDSEEPSTGEEDVYTTKLNHNDPEIAVLEGGQNGIDSHHSETILDSSQALL